MATAALVIGAVAAVAGTGYSVYSSVQAAKSQKKARRAQEDQMRADARRQRRQVLREARMRRATAINAGTQVGGQGSSSLAGGLSSLSSQTGENLGAMRAGERSALRISNLNQTAQNWGMRSQLGGAVAGLGTTLINNRQGIANLFGSNEPEPVT